MSTWQVNTIKNAAGTGSPTFNKSIVFAYRNAALSIATSTETSIAHDTEVVDILSQHSGGIFTASEAGYYRIDADIQFLDSGLDFNASNEYIELRLYKNASLYKVAKGSEKFPTVTNNPQRQTIAAIVDLAISDTIEVKVFQTSGVSQAVTTADKATCLLIHQL